LLTYLNILL